MNLIPFLCTIFRVWATPSLTARAHLWQIHVQIFAYIHPDKVHRKKYYANSIIHTKALTNLQNHGGSYNAKKTNYKVSSMYVKHLLFFYIVVFSIFLQQYKLIFQAKSTGTTLPGMNRLKGNFLFWCYFSWPWLLSWYKLLTLRWRMLYSYPQQEIPGAAGHIWCTVQIPASPFQLHWPWNTPACSTSLFSEHNMRGKAEHSLFGLILLQGMIVRLALLCVGISKPQHAPARSWIMTWEVSYGKMHVSFVQRQQLLKKDHQFSCLLSLELHRQFCKQTFLMSSSMILL